LGTGNRGKKSGCSTADNNNLGWMMGHDECVDG
jgi:hypothetical protein